MGLPEPALAETEESKRSPIFTKAGATGLVWGNEFPVEATLRLVTGPDDTKPVLVHARNANWDRWLGPGGQSSLRVDGLEVLTLSTVDPTGPVTIQVEYADGNGSRTLTLPVPDSLNPTA
jgi:hypothetical protein